MEIHLTKKDFKIEWFSGTGAGGQHRNKHQNCCRITHTETGLSAIGTGKERTTNQRQAFKQLAKRIVNHYQQQDSRPEINKTIIRNYNESRNEVHDKISGLKLPFKTVMNDISDMIEARRNGIIMDREIITHAGLPKRGDFGRGGSDGTSYFCFQEQEYKDVDGFCGKTQRRG